MDYAGDGSAFGLGERGKRQDSETNGYAADGHNSLNPHEGIQPLPGEYIPSRAKFKVKNLLNS